MDSPRQLPLFDAGHKPGTWNERMAPGEYAVHYSSLKGDAGTVFYCTVFGDMQQAVAHAQQQVEECPGTRCTIYDHRGFVGAPLRDIRGTDFKENTISARFRRWTGSILFFGGAGLTILDWSQDFRLGWPAMLGTRMLFPGLVLLFTEAMVMLHNRTTRLRAAEEDKV